jgi:hypothetical protein
MMGMMGKVLPIRLDLAQPNLRKFRDECVPFGPQGDVPGLSGRQTLHWDGLAGVCQDLSPDTFM